MRRKKRRVRVTKKAIAHQKSLHRRLTKIVKLKCSVMKHPMCIERNGKWEVDTTMPEIYTSEVRAKWVCPLCK